MKIDCKVIGDRVAVSEKEMSKKVTKLEDGGYILSLTKKKYPVSHSQQSLYWAILKQVEYQTGQDCEDIHIFIKNKFMWNSENGKLFPTIKSTSDLSTSEFITLIDKMVSFFTVNLNLKIKMPKDSTIQ